MARKFEIKVRDWLPHIIICYLEYEDLNSFEIFKHTGISRILGTATEQYNEIKSVLDSLVEIRFLKPVKTERAHYFGIGFDNITYEVADAFKKYVDETQEKAKNARKNENVVKYTINQKNYMFNLTFAIEKLAEFKTGLINVG